ncbi:MAG: RNA-directed DNA polymerase, partial [Candidatus Planktophila sp.]
MRIHEWMGAIVTFIAKQLSAVKISEFRPVASICAKFAIFMDIINQRLARFLEDHGLLEDAQEAFRKNRSTQRQLCKLQCLLAAQRRAKSLSVMLFLDIKNAFNAMNHRAIFHVMKLCGFPADDIRLFQRLYRRTFLLMGNLFGESAACFLARGVPQGSHPSPLVYILTFNPIHVIARICGKGCSMHGLIPNGSSGFADDTTLHTDGVNAVSSMQAIVSLVGAFLSWMGQMVNMLKSKISAINFANGHTVATDSIKLNGAVFPVQPPHKALKQLGVRIAMTDDFSEEKAYVMEEMKQRLSALRLDRVLSPILKELAIKIGVVPVFRYSAGVVPWTKTELEQISQLWLAAFKHAWTFSPKLDGSPISLDKDDGGRECPSASEEWVRAVLDLLEQCICLPGEISQIVTHHLEQTCLAHGCYALNQLQCLLRLGGGHGALSVVERLLLCLDEQGLVVSSPWPQRDDQLITAELWPQMWAAWAERQKWAGCRELSSEVEEQWKHAKDCLRACTELAQSRIWTTRQLRGSHGAWLQRDELSRRHCSLTAEEYSSLTSWLNRANTQSSTSSASAPLAHDAAPSQSACDNAALQSGMSTAYYGVLPPCIRGRQVALLDGAQVEMECLPDESVSREQQVSEVSDVQLVQCLCRSRAVFSFTADGSHYRQVECLAPYNTVSSEVHADESIIVGTFQPEPRSVPRLAVFTAALIRDTLRDNSIELLS